MKELKIVRSLKRQWDNNRFNPKVRFKLRRAIDNLDWAALSKKQIDEVERIECSL